MSTLNRDPHIVRLAGDLGLPKSGNCLKHIREYALKKVKSILASFPVNNLEDLRNVVANKLSIKVEWIETDEDIDRICEEYSDFHSALSHQLKYEFLELSTEGITFEREEWDPVKHRYLAVIDARGQRRYRAYFTTWHELTHILIHPAQREFPGFRRTPSEQMKRKDPIESLVDHISGHVAFYTPFFGPVITTEFERFNGLTFDAIENAKNKVAEEASLFATAIQSINHFDKPALFLRIDLGFKKSEKRIMESQQKSFDFAKPNFDPKLRAITVVGNNVAKEKKTFEIRQNMRVPQKSVLYEISESLLFEDKLTAVENQDWWETSASGPLSSLPIKVEAIRRGRFVYGLINLI